MFSITEAQQFASIKPQVKASVLQQYLVQGGNMEQVASQFGLEDSRVVSLITRGYGFAGQNSRRFAILKDEQGVALRDEEGEMISPTLDDFLDYVREYPQGYEPISGEGRDAANRGEDNLREFLLDRYQTFSLSDDEGTDVDDEYISDGDISEGKFSTFFSSAKALRLGASLWTTVFVLVGLLVVWLFFADGFDFSWLLIGALFAGATHLARRQFSLTGRLATFGDYLWLTLYVLIAFASISMFYIADFDYFWLVIGVISLVGSVVIKTRLRELLVTGRSVSGLKASLNNWQWVAIAFCGFMGYSFWLYTGKIAISLLMFVFFFGSMVIFEKLFINRIAFICASLIVVFGLYYFFGLTPFVLAGLGGLVYFYFKRRKQ